MINKMNSKRKVQTTIALLLVLSMSISFGVLSTANAHTPNWNIPTYAHITVMPNPIGVNQPVTIYFFIDKPFPSATIANDYRPHDYTLVITSPDGQNKTQKWSVVLDSTSSQYTTYVPQTVGIYTLTFIYPGQTYLFGANTTSSYYGDYFMPSTASTTLTVQSQATDSPVLSYPLPDEYWTRPIYGENTDWWHIANNWLGTGAPSGTLQTGMAGWGTGNSATIRFQPNAEGSLTSHVMWTHSYRAGGVVGGNEFEVPGKTYFDGSAYNNVYTNPIIINGKLYYTNPVSFSGVTSGATDCVDLRTGQTLWSRTDVPSLSYGLVWDVEDPNQHGTFPPLLFAGGGFGGGAIRVFDGDTGNPLFNVTGMPSGTTVEGTQGERLIYSIFNNGTTASPDYYLAMWNSSYMWTGTGFPTGSGLSPAIDTTNTVTWAWVNTTSYVDNVKTITSINQSTTTTAVIANLGRRYANLSQTAAQNMSLPWRNTGYSGASIVAAKYGDGMLIRNGSMPAVYTSWGSHTYAFVNLNKTNGQIGQILWTQTYNPPTDPTLANVTIYTGGVDWQSRTFYECIKETMQWYGYSLNDGTQIWGPTAEQTALDYYGQPYYPIIGGQAAYGKLYSSALGGILYCYDGTTGNLLWTYGNGGEGNTTADPSVPYGRWPIYVSAVCNGMVYCITTEHTMETPFWKGAMATCVDAETGKLVWQLPAYTGSFSVIGYACADGFSNFNNGYDNQIYTVGRGPSSITVDAPMSGVTAGSVITMRGTVTDVSAGTKQNEQAARFPNGVPVVSDDDMTAWMSYVYQQRYPKPNVTGVNIVLDIVGPDGNHYGAGAVSDDEGNYAVSWYPPTAGTYKVTANFGGTKAYWPSNAGTYFTAEAKPSPAVVPTATPTVPPTLTPPPTASPTPSPSPSEASPIPKSGIGTEVYVTIAAVVIIAIVAVVALVLRRRK